MTSGSLPLLTWLALGLGAACAGTRAPRSTPQVASATPGQEPEREPTSEPETEDPSSLEWLHGAVSSSVTRTATWFDAFLGDERALAEENRTRLDLELDLFSEEGESLDLGAGLDVRVVLPRAKERLQLVMQRDREEDELPASAQIAEPPGTLPEGEEREDLNLALRYLAAVTDRSNFRLDAGLRFEDLEPDPYAGLRFRHQEPAGTWRVRLVERLRLYSLEGWESRTWLDVERPFGEGRLLRATTSGSWYEERDGYHYGQRLTWFQRLRHKSLITLDVSAAFRTEPGHELESVRVRTTWSRRVAKDWVLVEVAPQVVWPQEQDYEPVLGLLLSLEVRFGAEP